MEGQISTTPSENPNSSASAATAERTSAGMPSSDSPQTHESKPQSERTHDLKTPETEAKIVESSDQPAEKISEGLNVKQEAAVPDGEGEEEEEEEEEEGECGFCLFMKGGGCREVFTAWEKCVEDGVKQEDIVEKCSEITANLKKCMEAHPDYYGPLLKAEKGAQEEAMKELEKDKEIEKAIEESAALDKDGVLPVSKQKNEDGS